MAIAAANSLAEFAVKRGINPQKIIPQMDEEDVFAYEAAAVALQAEKENVATLRLSWNEVFNKVQREITNTRALCSEMMTKGYLASPPPNLLAEALQQTIARFQN